jgi:polysaccharide biosynthesis protein PelF
MKYELPANVVHIETHYLYDNFGSSEKPVGRAGNREALDQAAEMHKNLLGSDDPAMALASFRDVARAMLPGGKLTLEDFLYSEESWNIICDSYRRHCTDPSFVDYFWTVRIMHQPLWMLARIAQNLPA